jgi:hypothetical protein
LPRKTSDRPPDFAARRLAMDRNKRIVDFAAAALICAQVSQRLEAERAAKVTSHGTVRR